MALKKKISKADYEKLADHLKAEYVERNGDYILDLEDDGALERAKEHEKELRKAGFSKAWYQKLTSGIVCLHVGEKAR